MVQLYGWIKILMIHNVVFQSNLICATYHWEKQNELFCTFFFLQISQNLTIQFSKQEAINCWQLIHFQGPAGFLYLTFWLLLCCNLHCTNWHQQTFSFLFCTSIFVTCITSCNLVISSQFKVCFNLKVEYFHCMKSMDFRELIDFSCSSGNFCRFPLQWSEDIECRS
jgi:hypothetical protein